jgi:hypothetical protein
MDTEALMRHNPGIFLARFRGFAAQIIPGFIPKLYRFALVALALQALAPRNSFAQEITLPSEIYAAPVLRVVLTVNLSYDMKADSALAVPVPRLSFVRRITLVVDSAIAGPDSVTVAFSDANRTLAAAAGGGGESGDPFKAHAITTYQPHATPGDLADRIVLRVYGADGREGHFRVIIEYDTFF